jgi:hypothetical protein
MTAPRSSFRLNAETAGARLMSQPYLNRLSVAAPDHDVHATFVEFADRT